MERITQLFSIGTHATGTEQNILNQAKHLDGSMEINTMPTFEDIKKANEAIVTTSLEHKDKRGNIVTSEYASVNQRVKAFRMVYPMGKIESFEKYCYGDIGKRVVCYECCVYDEKGNMLANGEAEEFESTTIEKYYDGLS